MLGCNNGIGGFHENLVTFREPKLPDFFWAQKVRLKKCLRRTFSHIYTDMNNNVIRFHGAIKAPHAPIFSGHKRCASKNAVLRCNNKNGRPGSVAPKCKMAENIHRIDRHPPKIGLNPTLLGFSNSS